MTIHITNRMELLSVAYIEAVAASIGVQVINIKVDNHSIDGTFYSSSGKCPRIDFQLKSTYAHQFPSGSGNLSYPLPVHNYNHLKSERCSPQILILLILPPDEVDWLSHSNDELLIRNCAYWKSLANAPDTTNTATVNVHFEKAAPLSPENLQNLLLKAEQGDAL